MRHLWVIEFSYRGGEWRTEYEARVCATRREALQEKRHWDATNRESAFRNRVVKYTPEKK